MRFIRLIPFAAVALAAVALFLASTLPIEAAVPLAQMSLGSVALHLDDSALPAVLGAGLIVNGASLNRIYTGFRTTFNQAFGGAQTAFDRVAMTVPSQTLIEEHGWMGQIPRFREWIGDRVLQNLSASSYQLKNKPFELTVAVDRDEIEDDRYGVYTPMVAEMGRAAKQHPDELVFALLKSGFNTKCYDGQYFFDTDHPVLDAAGAAQSQSNTGGGAGTPWYLLDTTRMVKPLMFQKRRDYTFVAMDNAQDEAVFMQKKFRYGVDARVNAGFALWQLAYGSKQTLDHANYAAARAAQMGRTGDYGRPLGISPNLLVVPPALEAQGRQVLMNERKANGEDNEWKGTAELLVVPWLA
jgi:phage major head subunit gpT-like protein